ncbi:MAG: hypothetical protein Kow00108_20330 [Calditrichia bacterium]
MINEHDQIILLLTTHLPAESGREVKPLTNSEYGEIAYWLKQNQLQPGDLLEEKNIREIPAVASGKISLERIRRLLDRGLNLGLALEKWERSGIWVMTRSAEYYPARLKQHLGKLAPPVLFASGNKELLKTKSIGVVGARDASATDLVYTRALGKKIAEEGFSVISGGARGVDEAAMLAALEIDGTCIGVVANNLLRFSLSGKYRSHIMNNNLLLMSPYQPEAGFNAGNAMGRNKYIYCLSEAVIVIRSDTSGGTWNGAVENIKKKWVPLYVRQSSDPLSGNTKLIQQGANPIPEDTPDSLIIADLPEKQNPQKEGVQQKLF